MLNKHRLMVPGPTPLPPGVTAAATLPMADERTPEFAEVFTRVIRRLQHVLGTGNDVLMLTSSMTGAFESAVQNLFSPGERVLVLDNGLFGRRWVDMCRAFGLEVTELGAPWGSEIEPAAVADALAADPGITAVLCVHCETSTGVVNDIRSCAAAARSARGPGDGVLVVVDAASGLGACELRTDEWGVDVVVGGGQKALMTPPGMSFVSVSERAWRRQAEARLPRFYFDWSAAALAGRAEIPVRRGRRRSVSSYRWTRRWPTSWTKGWKRRWNGTCCSAGWPAAGSSAWGCGCSPPTGTPTPP